MALPESRVSLIRYFKRTIHALRINLFMFLLNDFVSFVSKQLHKLYVLVFSSCKLHGVPCNYVSSD